MKKQRNKVSKRNLLKSDILKRVENNTQALMVDDYREIEARCFALIRKFGIKNANNIIYGGTPLTAQHFPYSIALRKFKP